MSDLQIDYDTDLMAAIDRVNDALAQIGYRFEDDGQDHTGFMLYTLVKLPDKEPPA